MSKKPRPTRHLPDGTTAPNPYATAVNGALMERNVQRRDFAIATLLDDIERREPAVGRYVRVRDAVAAHFNCSRSAAEWAIRDARVALAERFAAELPQRRAEVCTQLQRIADKQEDENPMAAVAALREIAHIVGLHAPRKLDVTVGITPEQVASVEALKLSPHERRTRIEELRARAALPAATPIDVDVDAEPS